ncbi:MAG: hypothetical protein JST54_28330 [Deltaproteobacteria bacterium]|nr:hypothetical protein [Deltaproteobacteria bacterium]
MRKLVLALVAVLSVGGSAFAASRVSLEGYENWRWGQTEDEVLAQETRIVRTPTSRDAYDKWREKMALSDALPIQMVAPFKGGFFFDGDQKLRAVIFRQAPGQGSLDSCDRILRHLEEQWGPAGRIDRSPEGNTFFASWALGPSEGKLNCNVGKDGRRAAEVVIAQRPQAPTKRK